LLVSVMNADNPDLSAFPAAGGKLVQFHGWNDGSPPPRHSVSYYEDVVKTMGVSRHAEVLSALHGAGNDALQFRPGT